MDVANGLAEWWYWVRYTAIITIWSNRNYLFDPHSVTWLCSRCIWREPAADLKSENKQIMMHANAVASVLLTKVPQTWTTRKMVGTPEKHIIIWCAVKMMMVFFGQRFRLVLVSHPCRCIVQNHFQTNWPYVGDFRWPKCDLLPSKRSAAAQQQIYKRGQINDHIWLIDTSFCPHLQSILNVQWTGVGILIRSHPVE